MTNLNQALEDRFEAGKLKEQERIIQILKKLALPAKTSFDEWVHGYNNALDDVFEKIKEEK